MFAWARKVDDYEPLPVGGALTIDEACAMNVYVPWRTFYKFTVNLEALCLAGGYVSIDHAYNNE